MRKTIAIGLFIIFVVLLIPAFSLLGLPSKKQEPPPSAAGSLSSEDLKNNHFYLVKDIASAEVLQLTPADYIKGVVAAEIPIDFHPEALKAQAVAAHTYTLRQIDNELKSPSPELDGAYLSTDAAKFQAYISLEELKKKWGEHFEANYKKLSDAVDSGIDEVMTYESVPIMAAFHSISGGKTESAKNVWGQEVSYLVPVESAGDDLSPAYQDSLALTDQEISHAFLSKYPEIKFSQDPKEWFSVVSRSESGTVLEMKVGSVSTTGREVRELLKLKSANFTVEYKDDAFTFTTSGYGHGVGMSQYGADYMARQGAGYKEILTHYYQGITLETIK